jgi:hypothetical protein
MFWFSHHFYVVLLCVEMLMQHLLLVDNQGVLEGLLAQDSPYSMGAKKSGNSRMLRLVKITEKSIIGRIK